MASTEEPTTAADESADTTPPGMPSGSPAEGAREVTVAAAETPVKRAPRQRASARTTARKAAATTPSAGAADVPVDVDLAATAADDSAPVAASDPGAATADPTAAPADRSTDPAPVAGTTGTAGARPASRTRRTRKAVAPVHAPEPTIESTHGAPADVDAPAQTEDAGAMASPVEEPPATAATSAPRKRAPRKRATKVAVTAPGLAETTAEAPVAEAGETVAETVDLSLIEGEPLDEVQPDLDGEGDDTAYQEPVATVASFGVLFQAPVPVVAPRRSRRASAPAAAPAAVEPAATVDDTVDPDAEPELLPADLGTDGTASADPTDSETDSDGEGDETTATGRRRRRRGGKGRRPRGTDTSSESAEGSDAAEATAAAATDDESADQSDEGEDDAAGSTGEGTGTRRRTRRRRRTGSSDTDDTPGVVTRVRQPRPERDEVTGVRGSTRLEAKRQRRREGREAGRRRTIITEAEFLARRESVERVMVVRARQGRTQIGVLEDGVLVEHYVSRETSSSMAGNIYLGRVQNVLPSMEAAFVDIGRGRNAVLYAGEVNWDAAGLEVGSAKRIENALESGQSVLVQVTKDPIGHKGARLTSQISLPGRYLVYVPDSSMTGISRKLPDTERARLKRILRDVVPESAGVIVRTAAEGASEEELRADVERLTAIWEQIKTKADGLTSGRKGKGGVAPTLLHGEPDMTVRVIRDVFNEDFTQLVVAGDTAWAEVNDYVNSVAPDLAPRLTKWTSETDIFTQYRVDEQIAKAMDRKVWLPSGGSLVIDRTEAMTVVDVNTGKFVGSGGNLEETVTRNNIEAAEEIVRQLRLRDIGGIIVIDFIDMVLESNRDLVVRRLLECLGRDRTKHQVAEVTSLGLVQMTRKRVGSGLIEVFSESCAHCNGRGYIVHSEPIERGSSTPEPEPAASPAPARNSRSRRGRSGMPSEPVAKAPTPPPGGPTPAQIAAAAHAAAMKSAEAPGAADDAAAGEGTEVSGVTDAAESMDVIAGTDVAQTPSEASAVSVDITDGVDAGAEATGSTEDAEPAAAESLAEPPLIEGDAATEAEAGTGSQSVTVEVTEEVTAQAAPTTSSARSRGRRRRGRASAPAGPPRPAS